MNIFLISIINDQFFGGEWGINSPRNSLSPAPLSLLEILYEREHTCIMDKDDYRDFYRSSVLPLFHSNDSALHYSNQLEIALPSTVQ